MVIVMSTLYFPTEKSEKVGKKWLEILNKFPADGSLSTTILPVAVRVTPDGMKAIGLSEVKEGKFDEFIKLLYAQILEWSKLEGLRSNIEVFMSGVDAMTLVGLGMPED